MDSNWKSGLNRKIAACITSISVFVLLIILSYALINSYTNRLAANERYEVSLKYHNLVDELQNFTNQNISLLSGFSAYIQMKDDFTDDDISIYLDFLLRDRMDQIRNVGIFKDTTIFWMYPLEGNESAIGVDFSKVPGQAEQLKKVKETLQPLFVGPVDLVQGGVGFIVRVPLIKNDAYWGMVSIVLKADQAFGFIEDHELENRVIYLITQPDAPENVVYGDKKVLGMKPLKFTTKATIGGWDVYIAPKNGWNNYRSYYMITILVSILFGLILARFIYKYITNFDVVLKDKIELEKKFILDRFTKIYTREYFHLRVQEEFSLSHRRKYPISMVYFDLDHFKEVNDNYGHFTGDKVLLEVVDIVKKIIRYEDVFSRWGGDEFILLLPHTDLKGAALISERIREGIESNELNQKYGVTASVGCSQWVECEYMESWFSRTDKALYTSKNTGKNKVTVNDHLKEVRILVKMQWNTDWNSGHDGIDREHQMLLDRCNSIIERSLSHSNFNETVRNVEAFIHEMEIHFKNEIEILQSCAYPDVETHIRIHEQLIEQSKEVLQNTIDERITTLELMDFLIGVVMQEHIQEEDRKYFNCLKAF